MISAWRGLHLVFLRVQRKASRHVNAPVVRLTPVTRLFHSMMAVAPSHTLPLSLFELRNRCDETPACDGNMTAVDGSDWCHHRFSTKPYGFSNDCKRRHSIRRRAVPTPAACEKTGRCQISRFGPGRVSRRHYQLERLRELRERRRGGAEFTPTSYPTTQEVDPLTGLPSQVQAKLPTPESTPGSDPTSQPGPRPETPPVDNSIDTLDQKDAKSYRGDPTPESAAKDCPHQQRGEDNLSSFAVCRSYKDLESGQLRHPGLVHSASDIRHIWDRQNHGRCIAGHQRDTAEDMDNFVRQGHVGKIIPWLGTSVREHHRAGSGLGTGLHGRRKSLANKDLLCDRSFVEVSPSLLTISPVKSAPSLLRPPGEGSRSSSARRIGGSGHNDDQHHRGGNNWISGYDRKLTHGEQVKGGGQAPRPVKADTNDGVHRMIPSDTASEAKACVMMVDASVQPVSDHASNRRDVTVLPDAKRPSREGNGRDIVCWPDPDVRFCDTKGNPSLGRPLPRPAIADSCGGVVVRLNASERTLGPWDNRVAPLRAMCDIDPSLSRAGLTYRGVIHAVDGAQDTMAHEEIKRNLVHEAKSLLGRDIRPRTSDGRMSITGVTTELDVMKSIIVRERLIMTVQRLVEKLRRQCHKLQECLRREAKHRRRHGELPPDAVVCETTIARKILLAEQQELRVVLAHLRAISFDTVRAIVEWRATFAATRRPGYRQLRSIESLCQSGFGNSTRPTRGQSLSDLPGVCSASHTTHVTMGERSEIVREKDRAREDQASVIHSVYDDGSEIVQLKASSMLGSRQEEEEHEAGPSTVIARDTRSPTPGKDSVNEDIKRQARDMQVNYWTAINYTDPNTDCASRSVADSVDADDLVTFRWRGQNYLLKMWEDIDFLDDHTTSAPVTAWLGFPARGNPFLVPPVGHDTRETLRLAHRDSREAAGARRRRRQGRNDSRSGRQRSRSRSLTIGLAHGDPMCDSDDNHCEGGSRDAAATGTATRAVPTGALATGACATEAFTAKDGRRLGDEDREDAGCRPGDLNSGRGGKERQARPDRAKDLLGKRKQSPGSRDLDHSEGRLGGKRKLVPRSQVGEGDRTLKEEEVREQEGNDNDDGASLPCHLSLGEEDEKVWNGGGNLDIPLVPPLPELVRQRASTATHVLKAERAFAARRDNRSRSILNNAKWTRDMIVKTKEDHISRTQALINGSFQIGLKLSLKKRHIGAMNARTTLSPLKSSLAMDQAPPVSDREMWDGGKSLKRLLSTASVSRYEDDDHDDGGYGDGDGSGCWRGGGSDYEGGDDAEGKYSGQGRGASATATLETTPTISSKVDADGRKVVATSAGSIRNSRGGIRVCADEWEAGVVGAGAGAVVGRERSVDSHLAPSPFSLEFFAATAPAAAAPIARSIAGKSRERDAGLVAKQSSRGRDEDSGMQQKNVITHIFSPLLQASPSNMCTRARARESACRPTCVRPAHHNGVSGGSSGSSGSGGGNGGVGGRGMVIILDPSKIPEKRERAACLIQAAFATVCARSRMRGFEAKRTSAVTAIAGVWRGWSVRAGLRAKSSHVRMEELRGREIERVQDTSARLIAIFFRDIGYRKRRERRELFLRDREKIETEFREQVAAIIIQGNIRRLLARVKARLARGAKRARAQARLARAARERAAYVRGKQLDERQREEGAIMMKRGPLPPDDAASMLQSWFLGLHSRRIVASMRDAVAEVTPTRTTCDGTAANSPLQAALRSLEEAQSAVRRTGRDPR